MLRSLKSVDDFTIGTTDNGIGRVRSFLFDSRTWHILYLVADTGTWLPGRQVLIAATALGEPDWSSRTIPVSLTKDQVREAPDLDADKPVSRQREIELHQYYGWTPYWVGSGVSMHTAPVPGPVATEQVQEAAQGDPNLRSTREVRGYRLRATDGEIGHVDDFISDDENWIIRYLAVDTRNWLPGRSVLISPKWVQEISWDQRQVSIEATREQVKNAPAYDPGTPVNRAYEIQLYDYYGRPKYWR
jgi:hypothetical protein